MIRDDELLRRRIHAALDGVHRPAPGLLRRSVDAAVRSNTRAPRLRALAVAAVLSLIAVAVVVLTLLQHQLSRSNPGPVQSPTPSPQAVLYTIDAGNGVVALDARSMRVVWRQSAAAAPSSRIQPTSLLQLSPDGRTLWTLPVSDLRGGTALRAYDAATGTPGPTVALSGGAVYSAIAVDPRSGMLAAVGQDASRIVVTLVDPQRRVVLSTTATRQLPAAAPVGTDLALAALFTPDGAHLFYSYGLADADRTGVDWADVRGAQLQPCRGATPGAACLPGAGSSLAMAGTNVLATGVANPQQLLELDATGRLVARVPTGLSGGLVAVGADGAAAAAVAPCDSGGGLVSVDLQRQTAQAIVTPAPAGAPPDPSTPCGVRPQVLPGSGIALSRLDSAAADPTTPGTVEVLDPASGRILREATLPAGVVDLLATP